MGSKRHFYGTPLSKSLDNDHSFGKNTPISSRRARIGQQQIVKDDQGRQRFHGAFTGGFSAGYYNTVGTIEGFKPSNFVSHRRTKHQNLSSSKFTHKPEDYMDDEDFGEFGIAPKKIRLSNQFTNTLSSPRREVTHGTASKSQSIVQPSSTSLGEKLLKCSRKHLRRSCKRVERFTVHSTISNDSAKNDLHGLGYKPLNLRNSSHFFKSQDQSNPLTAIFNDGKRIQISGEAFGSGVLEDDEDHLDSSDAYGYDDIKNYDFKSKSTINDKRSRSKHIENYPMNIGDIPGFVPAVEADSLELCDAIKKIHPEPTIPDDWIMPARKKPDLPLPNSNALSNPEAQKFSNWFNQKFTTGSPYNKAPKLESKVGLVSYTDLKDVGLNVLDSSCDENGESSSLGKILKEENCSLEWVRFDENSTVVAEESSPVGKRSSKFIERQEPEPASHDKSDQKEYREQPNCSRELKELIFNIAFDEDGADVNLDCSDICSSNTSDSEDKPHVLDSAFNRRNDNIDLHKEEKGKQIDNDLEIIVISEPKHEPELIILTSSSSSSSSFSSPIQSTSNCDEKQQHIVAEPDLDLYGPPLPPTLQTLLDVDCLAPSAHHRSANSKLKKARKRKKSKRFSSKSNQNKL